MKNKSGIRLTLLLASSLTVMSGAAVAPALPEITKEFSDKVPDAEFLSKLVLTIPALFIVACSPFAGMLIDRYSKKRFLIICMALYGLTGASAVLLNNIYHILISRALLGMTVAGVMTTVSTLVGDYFNGKERSSFVGIQGAFMALGGSVFVTTSGFLADAGWNYPFLIYLFSWPVLLLGLRYLYEPERIDHSQAAEGQPEGKVPAYLLAIIYITTFLGLVIFYVIPVQSPFLMHSIGIRSNSVAGMAIVVTTLTSALMSANYQKIKSRLSFSAIYCFGFSGMAAGFFIISLAHSVPLVLTGAAICGLGAGFIMPNGSLWLLQLAPARIRGKLMGGLTAAVFLGQFFSPIFFKPVIDATSLHGAHAIAAAVLLAAAIFFALFSYYHQSGKLSSEQ